MLTKKLQFIGLLFLLISVGAVGQTVVRGTVIAGEDKLPLPGVSVVVKGTSRGTITDIDGRYSIEVPANGALNFTFVGYQNKTENVDNRKVIDLTMVQENIVMDEVVVMGYSSQKKAELSSSVVTIKAEKLTDVTTADVGNMLQGKVAGVEVYNASGQPGAAAEIRIRGTGSISSDADPLYVVDGVPGGTFNPNDIETLTILKDAGATAIYGAAAAGGVIVITTKSAKKNQPTQVNFKFTGGIKQPLFGNFKMMDSEELYNTHKNLYSSSLFKILRPASLLSQDFNWQDAFFSNGSTQDYFVSLSGGSDKLSYYTSLDYYKEDGTLINTGFRKASARLNLNAKLTSSVDMNIRIAYNNSNDQSPSSWMTLNDAYTKVPWDDPYDANGELVYISSGTRPDTGGTWYSQDKWNALHSEQYNYSKSHSNGLVADFQLNWNITSWLTASSTNRFDQSSYKYVLYTDPRSYDPTYNNGYLLNDIGMSDSFGTTNILKAAYSFGEHSISGLAGWEWGKWKTEYTSASGTGMPEGMTSLDSTTPYSVGGYTLPGESWSIFGQAQYDYLKRYFLTLAFRADASSLFAPGKRIGYFPSAAASWLISNEDFLKGSDIVTFLKLRGSYGKTGNSNIGQYRYLSTFTLTSAYQNVVAATPQQLANPYLGWESAYMAGLGVDLNLWKDIIELNIDLYNMENKDLLLEVPTSSSTGFFEKLQNVGSVRNQGIEVQINSTPVKTNEFKWQLGFNVGLNKNKVLETTPAKDVILQSSNSVNQQVKTGQDIYSWYMPKWLGVDPANGDPLWEKLTYDAEGNITARESTNNYNEADFQVTGKATPLFSGGISNSFTYKGFFLNFNLNYVYGNKVYNYNRQALDADGAYTGYNQISLENNKLGWTRWEAAGDAATHPKLVLNGNKQSNSTSSRYLEDGSYLRLKNATFGYNFRQSWLKNAHIDHLKLYVSGDNLLTFTKFSGMDPEVSMKSSGSTIAGFYADNYPVSRQILIGIELGF